MRVIVSISVLDIVALNNLSKKQVLLKSSVNSLEAYCSLHQSGDHPKVFNIESFSIKSLWRRLLARRPEKE